LVVPDGYASGEAIRLKVAGAGNTAGRLLVDLGASADVRLFIDAEANGSVARRIDVYARSGSRLDLFLNYGGEARSFNCQRVYAEAGAHVKMSLVQSGGAFCQLATRVRLAGELASVRYRALAFGNGRGLLDESCRVVHAAESTHADILCGAVLGRGDKTVSQARLVLEPGVTGSTATQRSAALLVSEGAEYAAKPEFEARHDQLQCAHGAAVSGVNPERLFYLMSRGLDRSSATAALIDSFSAVYAAEFAAAGLDGEIADIMETAKRELITEVR
jgi:Fe-S cluster assembly protein SufD